MCDNDWIQTIMKRIKTISEIDKSKEFKISDRFLSPMNDASDHETIPTFSIFSSQYFILFNHSLFSPVLNFLFLEHSFIFSITHVHVETFLM